MSELSQSIDRLNRKANTLSRQARESKEQWITLCLPQIETVLRKLREKADKMIRVDSLDPQVLIKKTVRMYQGSQEEFTRREIRNLPFVIFSSELSMPVAKFALRQVDLDKTSCFRRLLFAYFRDYEPKERKTEWIRTVLGKQMQKSDRMVGTIHFLQDFPQLLDKDGASQMAEFFSGGNLYDGLKILSFPPTLYGSNFVKAAIVNAFQMDIGLDAKQKLLKDLTENLVYEELVPKVVGPVIISVDEEGSDSAKNWLMQLIFRKWEIQEEIIRLGCTWKKKHRKFSCIGWSKMTSPCSFISLPRRPIGGGSIVRLFGARTWMKYVLPASS